MESVGQISSDRRSDLAAIAVTGNVNQQRDIAIEAIPPRQHTQARSLVEMQDLQRKMIQRILIDLKQFVARISLEHIDQRLAGMAGRIETSAVDDALNFAPQIRNAVRGLGIGSRGEQTAEAMFADEFPGAIEALHPDIVEMHAPMHARTRARLGHDQERRFLQNRADLRGHSQRLVPLLQSARIRTP